MQKISASKAPAAIGPYSHAVSTGNLVFFSGQIPMDPATKQVAGDDIETQTKQVFTNIKAVAKEAGLSLENIVKTTVFLQDMNDFQGMNKVYEASFAGHKPARSAVEVAGLPLGVRVEIECIAEKS